MRGAILRAPADGREPGVSQARPYLSTLGWILRGVLFINVALFIVSFIPAVSGIGNEPGLFDRLLGNYRLYGWRADVLWVCASTPFIIIASIPFIVVGGVTEVKERRFHTTAILCLVWLGILPVYLAHVLLHMF